MIPSTATPRFDGGNNQANVDENRILSGEDEVREENRAELLFIVLYSRYNILVIEIRANKVYKLILCTLIGI